MLMKTESAMPQCTAGISSRRPLLRRYARLMATIRKASKPFTEGDDKRLQHGWPKTDANETQSQNYADSAIAGYPTGQVGDDAADAAHLPTGLTMPAQLITIVALGDSTTAGTPAFQSPIEAPPNGAGNVESQYAYWLMRAHPDWQVLNRGVNGERSDQIRARFERDAAQAAPDVVVIIAGVNDVYQGRTAAAVERELEAMYDGRAAPRRSRSSPAASFPTTPPRPSRTRACTASTTGSATTWRATTPAWCSATRGPRSRRRANPIAWCPLRTTCIRLLRDTN